MAKTTAKKAASHSGSTRRSMAQMRAATWSSEADAVRDLKRNGYKPQGADYYLGETQSGIWMLIDRADAPVSDEPPEFAKPPKDDPAVAREKVKEAAKRKKAAAAGRKPKEPAKEAPAEPKPGDPAPDDAAPQPDVFQYRRENGPYTLVPSYVVQHHLVDLAHAVSMAISETVKIVDKHGKTVFTVDGRAGNAKPKTNAKQRKQRAGSTPRVIPRAAGEPSEMQKRAIALATRKGGCTRVDLKKVSGGKDIPWTTLLKQCVAFGYDYSTTDAPEGSGARVVYHLTKKA